ncbi:N-benzyl-3-pyrrolidinol dehydrogenase [Mycena floridula]|nr:N-benzyl-3-pyrrolidinol dehydrogenase [Mycena floridula]
MRGNCMNCMNLNIQYGWSLNILLVVYSQSRPHESEDRNRSRTTIVVCRTDAEFLLGGTFDTRTFALGHEFCGFPVELGEGVDPDLIKETQLYSALNYAPCTHSLNGTPAIFNSVGLGLDGGYAEYVVVDVDQLVEVPTGVSPELAAIAADAGVTAFNAVHNTAGIKKGTNSTVLIFGIGGLGHLGVQYAKYFEATVYACDIRPAARKLAVELGAVEAYNLIELNKKIADGFKVDITIDFVGTNETFNLALALLSNNDTTFPSTPKAVLVGETLTASSVNLITANIHVLTSLYGPPSALVAALDLFTKVRFDDLGQEYGAQVFQGIIHGHVEAVPLRAINEAIDDLLAFRTVGRKVVIPGRRLAARTNTI